MKKIVIGFMVLVICSILLMSIEENPFDSFMGMKWGINADEFYNGIKYDVKFYGNGFFIKNFPLGDIIINEIIFNFKNISSDQNLKFKEKNYSQFIFDKAVMKIEPDQFENILQIFKKKYGDPTKVDESKIQNRMGAQFNQIKVLWEKDGRMIQISRYYNKIDEGLIILLPKIDRNKLKKDSEKETEAAADIL